MMGESKAMPERSEVADYRNPARLDGKGFVLFGAGQGIGRQTCHALAQAGARVLCVDREPELAQAVADEIGGEAIAADVTSREGVESVFAKASTLFGESLSGLVDIVGVADIRRIDEMDDSSWSRNFDIVLRHAWLGVQIGSRVMRKGGSMVFVSSMSGTLSVENQAGYGIAKAALNHLVHCAAHELGPLGIRVNAVSPGFVRTPRLKAALAEDFWRGLVTHIPLRRAAEPSDIAKAILFLASDMSTCITGAVVPIDGGMSLVAALPPIPLKPGRAQTIAVEAK
jgi:NAD(P)-dependent dehydrogenase (short-subunit alcohol dehydrogenase family)